MWTVLRRFVSAASVGLLILACESSAARADDLSWGRIQTSSDVSAINTTYYYNNAAPASVAPTAPSAAAANSDGLTYRSYAPDAGSLARSYYFSPGPCGCYYYVPGPSPAMVQSPASSATAPATSTANAATGTYRSFSPDTGANATSAYTPVANSGTYVYPSSRGGHSWGGRR